MKKYATALMLILLASVCFADDKVVVVMPEVTSSIENNEITFLYSGNAENFSDKPALVVFSCSLVDDDMNILDKRVVVATMEPRSRSVFNVTFTFPIDEFLDEKCVGILCLIEYSYPGGYEI